MFASQRQHESQALFPDGPVVKYPVHRPIVRIWSITFGIKRLLLHSQSPQANLIRKTYIRGNTHLYSSFTVWSFYHTQHGQQSLTSLQTRKPKDDSLSFQGRRCVQDSCSVLWPRQKNLHGVCRTEGQCTWCQRKNVGHENWNPEDGGQLWCDDNWGNYPKQFSFIW